MRLRYFQTPIVRRNRIEIEPEEIFMDSLNHPGFIQEMSEGRLERPISHGAFLAVSVAIGLGFLIVSVRLGYLAIVRGGEFRKAAMENRTVPMVIQAPRGIIFDRTYEKFVENAPTFSIFFERDAVPGDDEFIKALERLAQLTGQHATDIAIANEIHLDGSIEELQLRRNVWPEKIFIASGELRDAVLEIRTSPEQYPGAVVVESSRRNYLLESAAGHLLGYVGRPTRNDLSDRPDIKPNSVIGKTGLEAVYDDELRGEGGEKLIEVAATGEALRERFITKPEPGYDLVLEVDAGLQRFAAETLARHIRALGKRRGALVAIDPRSGAVRALVSYPSYNPNTFEIGDHRAIRELLSNPENPFFNRAISGGYPAGSTIKPFLAAAALEERVITPEREILSTGALTVPNPYDPEKPSIFKDWRPLGWLDMRKAIAMSSNVYFYTIGGGFGDIKGLGIERIKHWLERFGWGRKLGIDLPGEFSGAIPNPEAKRTLHPEDPTWRVGDTYITAIGQGDLRVTPLQLAVAGAAIANGGTVWQPRIAAAVVDGERRVLRKFTPIVIARDVVSAGSLRVIREGMRESVHSGTASALADLPVAAAGKTGTAQTGAYGKNHGWFWGFAPYEQPEILITVLVEEGSGGSTDAVPIAKEVLFYYFTAKTRGTDETAVDGGID